MGTRLGELGSQERGAVAVVWRSLGVARSVREVRVRISDVVGFDPGDDLLVCFLDVEGGIPHWSYDRNDR